MSKVTFQIEFDTNTGEFSVIKTDTGEIKSVKKKNAPIDPGVPQLILEDNKYTLSPEAVNLLGVGWKDRLCIKYKKIGKQTVPVIGTEEVFKTKGGNQLTKANTVSFRGKANEELASHGSMFILVENPDGSGTFILQGDKPLEIVEDEAVNVEDEDITKDLQEIGDSVESEDVSEVDVDELDSILNDL